MVGCITPWNYPLHQIAAKVAPALAAGCTVVVKPSEVAPLNAFVLADIMDEVGLPAGVFNLVTGFGPVVGEAIAAHRDVDMVSFTGSTRAGKRVTEVAAGTVKRVALELGGKSANVILADADLAVGRPRRGGQVLPQLRADLQCPDPDAGPPGQAGRGGGAGPHRGRVVHPGRSLRRGRPGSGPLVSSAQRDRVRMYIDKGVGEGATLVTGGAETPDGLDSGFFVAPTVFTDVTRDMTIAREEIFGPVLVIIPYDTEEEAVEIANDTDYGLAGGVWSADPEHAKAVARRLRTGQVEVNGGGFNPDGPVRRLQAVGQRPRVRLLRTRGVPRGQVPPALRTLQRADVPVGYRTDLVLGQAEVDAGGVGVGLLADEDVLGAGVEVAEGPLEARPLADRRGAGGQVGPLDDLAARLGGVGGGHPQVGAHRRGQLAAVGDVTARRRRRCRARAGGPPSTWPCGGTDRFWNVVRLASAPSSPIRTLVMASSATSSSMLFATPSAHDACPAAVIGHEPHAEGRRSGPARGYG